MNGGVVLLEMVYTIGIKHSYRGHHYILQNVLVLKAVHVTYTMEHSNPYMGDPAQQRTDTQPLCMQVDIY
jgi:hypothetical protein